jgi:hypothetical protein
MGGIRPAVAHYSVRKKTFVLQRSRYTWARQHIAHGGREQFVIDFEPHFDRLSVRPSYDRDCLANFLGVRQQQVRDRDSMARKLSIESGKFARAIKHHAPPLINRAAKSMVLTPEGLRQSERLFRKLFTER